MMAEKTIVCSMRENVFTASFVEEAPETGINAVNAISPVPKRAAIATSVTAIKAAKTVWATLPAARDRYITYDTNQVDSQSKNNMELGKRARVTSSSKPNTASQSRQFT